MARVYLSKKIVISNGVHVRSVCWNPDEDWIAFGGLDGMAKVFKLEQSGALVGGAKVGSAVGLSHFSMNQSLNGHSGPVTCMAWNTIYRRLASGDENGTVIVWALHKGTWYKTMINNRKNSSTVQDMCWTSDGKKICIIYNDGTVITGSINGQRLWQKDLGMRLKHVRWSPDDQSILVSSLEQCILYDSMGNKLKALSLRGFSTCQRAAADDDANDGGIGNDNDHHHLSKEEPPQHEDGDEKKPLLRRVANIDWYNGSKGYTYNGVPTLAIGLCYGRVQVSTGVDEKTALSIRTGICLKHIKWSYDGSMLALGGKQQISAITPKRRGEKQQQQQNIVKFYTPDLKFIHSITIPGECLNSISWEGMGQRIALAADEFIYIFNLHPKYMWDYASSVGVVAYVHHNNKHDKNGSGGYVTFWDTKSQECNVKQVSLHLKGMKGAGELFCLVSEYRECCTEREKYMAAADSELLERRIPTQTVTLYNSIGQCLGIRNDIKVGDVIDTAMCCTHFVLAGVDAIYVWQYKSASKVEAAAAAMAVTSINEPNGPNGPNGPGDDGGGESGSCSEYIIDLMSDEDNNNNSVITIEAYRELLLNAKAKSYMPKKKRTVGCLAISNTHLVVANEGGEILIFALPTVTFKTRLYSPTELNELGPKVMKLNSNSQLLAMVDDSGVMRIVPIDPSTQSGEDRNEGWWKRIDKKRGVWDICWSRDDPNQLAIMEKNKLHILEEGVDDIIEPSTGNLYHMENLEVMTLRLGDIMAGAAEFPNITCVERKETRLLRNAREVMATIGLEGAYSYICSQDPPAHSRLWRMLAESSLEALELSWALKAFVRCHDFWGIRFIQRLIKQRDRMIQRAEISAWFGRYNEAEALYQDMGRKDLAIDLRQRSNDWFHVAQLLKQSGGHDDDDDAQMTAASWDEIGHYYSDRGCWAEASQYYKQAGNVSMYAESLFRMEDYEALTELLASLPHDSSELVRSGNRLVRMGLLCPATDALCSIWRFQEAHGGFHQINGMLAGKVGELLRLHKQQQQQKDINDDCGAYYYSKLLVAEVFRKANRSSEAALTLLVKRHRNEWTAAESKDAVGGSSVPMSLPIRQNGETEPRTMKVLDAAWRSAEAYHFLILVMNQLHEGNVKEAMHTAIRCAEFDDVLERVHIYSLLAFAAYHYGFYGICSKAMMQLETLPWKSKREEEAIQTIAIGIFSMNEPVDPEEIPRELLDCLNEGRAYQSCVFSGKLIKKSTQSIACRVCQRYSIKSELGSRNNCPLCHAVL